MEHLKCAQNTGDLGQSTSKYGENGQQPRIVQWNSLYKLVLSCSYEIPSGSLIKTILYILLMNIIAV